MMMFGQKSKGTKKPKLNHGGATAALPARAVVSMADQIAEEKEHEDKQVRATFLLVGYGSDPKDHAVIEAYKRTHNLEAVVTVRLDGHFISVESSDGTVLAKSQARTVEPYTALTKDHFACASHNLQLVAPTKLLPQETNKNTSLLAMAVDNKKPAALCEQLLTITHADLQCHVLVCPDHPGASGLADESRIPIKLRGSMLVLLPLPGTKPADMDLKSLELVHVKTPMFKYLASPRDTAHLLLGTFESCGTNILCPTLAELIATPLTLGLRIEEDIRNLPPSGEAYKLLVASFKSVLDLVAQHGGPLCPLDPRIVQVVTEAQYTLLTDSGMELFLGMGFLHMQSLRNDRVANSRVTSSPPVTLADRMTHLSDLDDDERLEALTDILRQAYAEAEASKQAKHDAHANRSIKRADDAETRAAKARADDHREFEALLTRYAQIISHVGRTPHQQAAFYKTLKPVGAEHLKRRCRVKALETAAMDMGAMDAMLAMFPDAETCPLMLQLLPDPVGDALNTTPWRQRANPWPLLAEHVDQHDLLLHNGKLRPTFSPISFIGAASPTSMMIPPVHLLEGALIGTNFVTAPDLVATRLMAPHLRNWVFNQATTAGNPVNELERNMQAAELVVTLAKGAQDMNLSSEAMVTLSSLFFVMLTTTDIPTFPEFISLTSSPHPLTGPMRGRGYLLMARSFRVGMLGPLFHAQFIRMMLVRFGIIMGHYQAQELADSRERDRVAKEDAVKAAILAKEMYEASRTPAELLTEAIQGALSPDRMLFTGVHQVLEDHMGDEDDVMGVTNAETWQFRFQAPKFFLEFENALLMSNVPHQPHPTRTVSRGSGGARRTARMRKTEKRHSWDDREAFYEEHQALPNLGCYFKCTAGTYTRTSGYASMSAALQYFTKRGLLVVTKHQHPRTDATGNKTPPPEHPVAAEVVTVTPAGAEHHLEPALRAALGLAPALAAGDEKDDDDAKDAEVAPEVAPEEPLVHQVILTPALDAVFTKPRPLWLETVGVELGMPLTELWASMGLSVSQFAGFFKYLSDCVAMGEGIDVLDLAKELIAFDKSMLHCDICLQQQAAGDIVPCANDKCSLVTCRTCTDGMVTALVDTLGVVVDLTSQDLACGQCRTPPLPIVLESALSKATPELAARLNEPLDARFYRCAQGAECCNPLGSGFCHPVISKADELAAEEAAAALAAAAGLEAPPAQRCAAAGEDPDPSMLLSCDACVTKFNTERSREVGQEMIRGCTKEGTIMRWSPCCFTFTQHIEACLHMTCPQCRTRGALHDWCFHCGVLFPTDQAVYDHLAEASAHYRHATGGRRADLYCLPIVPNAEAAALGLENVVGKPLPDALDTPKDAWIRAWAVHQAALGIPAAETAELLAEDAYVEAVEVASEAHLAQEDANNQADAAASVPEEARNEGEQGNQEIGIMGFIRRMHL